MSKKDDGGSAFPHWTIPGMSLRDYFAAKVMAAIISDSRAFQPMDEIARVSYAWADAMIAERKKS